MGDDDVAEIRGLRHDLAETRERLSAVQSSIETYHATRCVEHTRRIDDMEERERMRDRELNRLVGKLMVSSIVGSAIVTAIVTAIIRRWAG